MELSFRHMKAILAAFPFLVAVLLSGCGSGCGTLGVANTSPCDSTTSSGTTSSTSTFNISGTVSAPTPGNVTINLSGAAATSATPNASGTFTFTALPTGSFTVVPSATGITFNPVSTAVTITSANVTLPTEFLGTITTTGTFSISGTISSGTATGAVVQNVLITLTGGNTGSALTDQNGHYTFSGLAAGTVDITVQATLTGHLFISTNNNNTVTPTSNNTATINFTATQ